ncbi:MAG: hypothetical protein IJC98_04975 [Clostridia bacterium]|nr:hypothetical protein [Clostridia bacterium]
MKKNTRLLLTAMALLLTISVCVFVAAADEEETDEVYKGSDLPVSESYVIRALTALEERINQKIDALAEALLGENDSPADTDIKDTKEETDDIVVPEKPDVSDGSEEDTDEPAVVSSSFEVVRLEIGQAIIGNCEMILRSGTAIAFCPGINGISDLTAGADLADETNIPLNHLLLVPRDDGRGIFVTSGEAYVMVRGTYTVLG